MTDITLTAQSFNITLVAAPAPPPVDPPPSVPPGLQLSDHFCTPEEFGAVGDGIADDTEALNAAGATSKPVRLRWGRTYRANGQLDLGQASGKRWFSESWAALGIGGGATILLAFDPQDAGPCAYVGGADDDTIQDVAFERIRFEQDEASDRFCFQTRKLRGVRFNDCQFVNIANFMQLGSASDATYIAEFNRCEGKCRADFPTIWLDVVNFSGQLMQRDCFIEGSYHANSRGLRALSNVQQRVDHISFSGGYFSRFGKIWDIQTRVVNLSMGNAILLEGWGSIGVHIGGSGSYENFDMVGVKFGYVLPTAGQGVLVDYTQTTNNCDLLNITGVSFAMCRNQPAIQIAVPAANPTHTVIINGIAVAGCIDNGDCNHAVIELFNVASGSVSAISARCTDPTKRYAHVVRSQGADSALAISGASISGVGFAGAAVASA